MKTATLISFLLALAVSCLLIVPLLQVNGLWALTLLLLPVLIALITGFTTGLFCAPSTLIMIVAAVLPR